MESIPIISVNWTFQRGNYKGPPRNHDCSICCSIYSTSLLEAELHALLKSVGIENILIQGDHLILVEISKSRLSVLDITWKKMNEGLESNFGKLILLSYG